MHNSTPIVCPFCQSSLEKDDWNVSHLVQICPECFLVGSAILQSVGRRVLNTPTSKYSLITPDPDSGTILIEDWEYTELVVHNEYAIWYYHYASGVKVEIQSKFGSPTFLTTADISFFSSDDITKQFIEDYKMIE